jgi:hypothetical protein
MSAALYITAKRKPRNFDMHVMGKALAAAEEDLSVICSRLGVKRLMDFVGMGSDELADLLGDEIPNAPAEQWFEPKEGLATVCALLRCLEAGTVTIESSDRVIEDLRQCERVLSHLEKRKIQWHFALDI